MQKPAENEYVPYYKTYIKLVPDADILKTMESQLDELTIFFNSIPEQKAGYRYAEDKWSIKEILGHMADTERIFAYRALCISRRDKISLPGFEQDDYVKYSNFDRQTLNSLLNHFIYIRKSTIEMFKEMEEDMSKRIGIANGKEISVRAIAYVIVGHAAHHTNVIKEKYL